MLPASSMLEKLFLYIRESQYQKVTINNVKFLDFVQIKSNKLQIEMDNLDINPSTSLILSECSTI